MRRLALIVSIIASVFLLSACEPPQCQALLDKFHESAPKNAVHVNLPLIGGVAGIFGVPQVEGDENSALPSDVLVIAPAEIADETELQEGFKNMREGTCIAPNKMELKFMYFHKDQPKQ